MGAFTHMTTIYGGVRPFGAALLLAGADPESGRPELYCVEPSGMALRYFGAAVGKGARAAKTEIEKEKLSDMTVADAIGRIAKMCVSHAVWLLPVPAPAAFRLDPALPCAVSAHCCPSLAPLLLFSFIHLSISPCFACALLQPVLRA